MYRNAIALISVSALQGMASAGTCVDYPESYFLITYDDTCLQCTSSTSFASAHAFTTYAGCTQPGNIPCNTECAADVDVDSSGCSTSAFAGAGGDCFDPNYRCVSAIAQSSHSSGTIFSLVDLDFPCCIRAVDGSHDQSGGVVGGAAGVRVDFNVNEQCPLTVTYSGIDPCTSTLPTTGPREIFAGVAFTSCDSVCFAQIRTPNGFIEIGSACGLATVDIDVCGPSDSVNMITIAFTDAQFDLSGDGRFSQVDVDLLQAQVGNSATGTLEDFDVNGNGLIDNDDVMILQELINCGLGSGIFGDTNNDGQADCCDLADYAGALGSVVSDSSYVVELDFDLDGDIDSVDQAEYNKVCVADFNDDYSLDFLDVSAFLSAYGMMDPAADINGDGSFDFQDISAFLAMVNASCS